MKGNSYQLNFQAESDKVLISPIPLNTYGDADFKESEQMPGVDCGEIIYHINLLSLLEKLNLKKGRGCKRRSWMDNMKVVTGKIMAENLRLCKDRKE